VRRVVRFGGTGEFVAAPLKDERMNRARGLAGLSRRNFLAWSAVVGAAGLAGCKHTSTPAANQPRSQIGEDPSDPDSVTTIGSKTIVSNTEPFVVSGVGLVYQLAGTGSSPSPGGWRSMLEENLKKIKRDQALNTKELLDGPGRTTSLVLLSALLPPGARKGDLIDVQVTLPEDSKTTSLQGGVLFPCELTTTDTSGNIHAQFHGGENAGPSGRLLIGNTWAKAQGPLVAGNFVAVNGKPAPVVLEADGRPACRAGLISDGATLTGSRPYLFLLNPNDQRAAIAAAIAERLNTTFHTTADPNLKVAEAKDRETVVIHVPTAYRHNHYRFLLVARQVPYLPLRADSPVRQKLAEELMDPSTALTAAIKLEALGGDCRQSLLVGLESWSPWVRFAAAEALAYLGQTDGVGELGRLAEDHPALRAPALLALASVDDASGTDRLVEMLSSSDPELRQGAFIALRLADDRHPALGGRLMNRSYWMHQIAPDAPPAVQLRSFGRSEVLLCGDVKFRGTVPPLALGTEFTVSVPAGQLPKVTRVFKGRDGAEVKEVRCTEPKLSAALAALAALGGGYSEAIELIRKADRAEVLTGPLVLDAIPRQLSVQQLAGFSKVDNTLAKANLEVARVGTGELAVGADGFELPSGRGAAARSTTGPVAKPPLNRDPGHLFGPIFGPKRDTEAPRLDPAVVPAGGGNQ
jgi:hypothetical protein